MSSGGKRAIGAEVGFEEIYARAGADLESVPWASLAAHPALVAWLDGAPEGSPGAPALVVGCGFGDDAEALAARGWAVTAFDVAPTAIKHCRRRFPASSVDYRVADLFGLPGGWQHAFELVVEIRTLQSLALAQRAAAALAIAGTVRPGGRLFLRCLARDAADPVNARPWPVSRDELRPFTDAGLDELRFHDEPPASGHGRSFTVVYQRPWPSERA